MIPFEEAFRIVMDSARPVGTEQVSIDASLGRVLAEDVRSDMDMPPFNKAAMDGYACRRADLGDELTVVETLPAGHPPTKPVGEKQCAKIMTGAMVPEGADCVVMVEFTESPAEATIRFTGKDTRDNICIRGEDIKSGAVVLPRGTLVRPEHVAMLATVGCVRPSVSQRVKVGVISTGNEIIEPSERPRPSQIRNSNGYQLVAQAAWMGAAPSYCGIAADDRGSLDRTIKEALAGNDVVVLSGGVSMGEFDLVPEVLRDNGVELLFQRVATKPGKPTTFGVSEEALVFGLPGNPVSTFVLFEVLVKPLLYRIMGHKFAPPHAMMPLEETITRKKVGRTSWLPVALTESGAVRLAEYHGSAHASALCVADGLITIPVGVSELKKGTVVHVRQF